MYGSIDTGIFGYDSTPVNYIEQKVWPVDTLKEMQDSLIAEDKLKAGKKLYEKKCRKCHLLYEPRDFKLDTWKKNLDEMTEKAELSGSDRDIILFYLAANCKKK